MTSARLLSIFLLLYCSIPVLAQNSARTTGQESLPDSRGTVKSEPWRIIPESTAKAGLPNDPLARLQASQPDRYNDKRDVLINSDAKAGTIPLLSLVPEAETTGVDSLGRIADDATCLKIRSYVVARDSKDSDSTHLVRYSTCQPASRYQLRTAVGSTGR